MKKYLVHMTLAVLVVGASGSIAVAQNQNYQQQRQYAQPDYNYCQGRAQQVSGYFGDVPDRYLDGGALRGAAKRAETVGAIAWIAGGNKKEIRKAKKRAARRGALEGAIRRGIAKDKQRKKRERYEFELRACMSSGR